jgi:urocanate hydratase
MLSNLDISKAMTIKLDDKLPKCLNFTEGIRRAPKRELD